MSAFVLASKRLHLWSLVMGGTGMADWALSVTWWRGYPRNSRNIMSDAGLAGPMPELLFPSVLLATALIFPFNAVVVSLLRARRLFTPFSSSLFAFCWQFVIYLVLHSLCYCADSFLLWFLVSLHFFQLFSLHRPRLSHVVELVVGGCWLMES